MTCDVCPHACPISEGKTGLCGVRRNQNGKIILDSYGVISAIALDPIEKKPLKKYMPGSNILSIGSFGCNLRCPWCQNHRISLDFIDEHVKSISDLPQENYTPTQIAELAGKLVSKGNIGVAYTYNEPTIGYEYVLECAKAVHEIGLKNVLVTNGFVNPRPWKNLLPFMDAMNIDLKGFSDGFYRRVKGDLERVKANIVLATDSCHVEVTTLIIPGENDIPAEMDALSRWLASVDSAIPLHLSRFFPSHRMNEGFQPTPKEVMFKLQKIALNHLDVVFLGNM